jgi:two-component system, cell cycle sensor histidine kinase and response regulator CckA
VSWATILTTSNQSGRNPVSLLVNTLSPIELGQVAKTQPETERPITIVVAEDEDALRGMMVRILGEQGYRMLEARDGGEALHLAHLAWPYLHLVVTDVVMPGMGGAELGRRLALDCPGLPVLYISAYGPGDIFHRGAPDPSIPFLAKPFTYEELLTVVQGLLATSKPTSGAAPSAG